MTLEKVPLDYWKMARISSNEEEGINSVIAEIQTSDSFLEDSASAHMAQENSKGFMKRMDEYENIIHKQQEFISEIRKMLQS